LEDVADRPARLGAEEEVEVVGHQAVAEEPKGIAIPGHGEGLEEGEVIVVVGEDGGAVVAAVERVIDEAVADDAGEASHGLDPTQRATGSQ
jgi:hypothetical protein